MDVSALKLKVRDSSHPHRHCPTLAPIFPHHNHLPSPFQLPSSGDNDVTILLKPCSGSRRWQHLRGNPPSNNNSNPTASPPSPDPCASPVESNYTIILGSHQNTCLKFEKDGELVCMVNNVPGSRLNSNNPSSSAPSSSSSSSLPGTSSFGKFWINYHQGAISVGCGDPTPDAPHYTWIDKDPIPDIRFAGLSAWDKHVGYRDIKVHPAIDFEMNISSINGSGNGGNGHGHALIVPSNITTTATTTGNGGGSDETVLDQTTTPPPPPPPSPSSPSSPSLQQSQIGHSNSIPTLLTLSAWTALSSITPSTVCTTLQVTDCLSPVLATLRSAAVSYAARHFQQVVAVDVDGFASLTPHTVAEILMDTNLDFPSTAYMKSDSSCSGEMKIHKVIMQWSGYGHEPSSPSSPCRPVSEIDLLLPLVRYPLMTPDELKEISGSDMYRRSNVLMELIAEAEYFLKSGESMHDTMSVPVGSPVKRNSGSGINCYFGGGGGGDDMSSIAVGSMWKKEKEKKKNNNNGSGSDDDGDSLRATTPTPSIATTTTARTRRSSLMMNGGRRMVAVPGPQELIASNRFRFRKPRGSQDLTYMYDGDHNGVSWYLGTAYGKQKWVNPVLAGRLSIKASSPECRNTDSKALVSGNFLRNNFAGPRRTQQQQGGGGEYTSWWVLDLGPLQRLAVNHYLLRADGSQDFLRSWVLQGSHDDGQTWVDLKRHLSDVTLRMPGQWASWPVTGHAAAVAYRMFRILLVGPNTGAPNPHHISLSSIELYGSFFINTE